MGRKTDVLLRGFRAAKCLTLLKVATARIKVLRNKRSVSGKQMRGEIAQLLKSGQDAHVYITKADALIKQENMVAVYDLIDEYCHAIISRFPAIEMQRNCPIDMKEPIASIIFAAPRCVELSELAAIKEAFIAKYGKDFAAAAAELRPDCGVNRQIIELLSTRPASGQMKVKIMKEICVEHDVQWTPAETLGEPSTTNPPVGSSQQHVEPKVEAAKFPGDVGSNKAKIVEAAPSRVGETGPSNIDTQTPLPGGPKHAGSTKLGLAAVESLKTGDGSVFVSSASKTSDTKLSSLSKEDVGKPNASVFQSVKGAMHAGTSSGKFGGAAVGSSKTDGGALLGKDASNIHDTTHSSFAEEDVERLNARILQSLKGSMDTGTSRVTMGSFKESQGEPETEAGSDVHVEPVVDVHDGMSDSDSDSFVSVEEGRLEDDIELSLVGALSSGRLKDDIEPSSVGAASKSESFAKISVQAFEEANVNGPSLSKKPSREVRESSSSYTESSQKDVYSRASSKNSSLPMESSLEDMFHRASSKNSLNTEASLAEKSFKRESRKSSLREEELVAEHSFKEKILLEKKVTKEESSEAIEDKGLRRKDILEGVSFGATTESSGTKKPVEEYGIDVSRNKMTTEEWLDEGDLSNKGNTEDMSVVETTESLVVEKLVEEYPLDTSQIEKTTEYMSSLPASDMQKIQSFSDRISAEEMSSGAGGESCLSNEKLPESVMDQVIGLPCKVASSNFDKSPEIVNNEVGGMPALEKRVEDQLGASSLGTLATTDYSNDFAATAKAIAAEAARLAVLDYAKRIAGSNSLSIDLGDLTQFGLAFEQNTKGSQVGKILSTESKSVRVDGQDLQYEGDGTNARKDVVQEEKASKVEIYAYDDNGDRGDHANIDEMGHPWDAAKEKSLHLKKPGADEGGNVNDANMGKTWTMTGDVLKQQPEITTGIDDINPFASEIVNKLDKDAHPLFSKTGEHESRGSAKPGLMSKAGGFGQEDDHLDVFFRRKTAWLHEETPRFDEDRYNFINVKSSFIEEKVPYHAFDKKESSFQDNFVPTPLFDNVPERQKTFSEKSSSSFKSPVFDNIPERHSTFSEERLSSFKSPVFDEGPEPYDASFSFNDGLDESNLSVSLSDKQGPQFPPNIKAPPSFDLEPEPCFDKVVDEEDQFSMEKKESTQMGHLKWQSKKTEEKVGSSVSDASLGGPSKPMSRRSRKQPQRIDDYEYNSEMPAEDKSAADGGNSSLLTSKRPIGSSSSLMQHQQKEQGRNDKDNVAEKGNVRTKPVQSFAYSSDTMSRRPSSISPKRVEDHDPSNDSQLDRWDSSVGGRIPSGRTTKSPTRLAQRQEVALEESDAEYYFTEGKNHVGSSSAGSRRTTKSPSRVPKQQLFAKGYDEVRDDAEGYKTSTKPSRRSKLFEQDLSEDDSIEEIQARYKPVTQTNDLGKRTPARMGTYSQQKQQLHRPREEYNSETGYKQYGQINDVGRSNPSSRLSAGRRQQQDLEEEQDRSTLYKPFVQVDDYIKSSPSRPLSSTQQQKPVEEEGPALASRYNDFGRKVSSSPHWQRQQHRQEEQQEVFMEQGHDQGQEEDEFYSSPLPDWRQDQRRKEKQRIPMALYGQQQDLKLERKSSELAMEEHEQQHEEQGPPLLGGKERRHRPLLTGRQEGLKIEKENPGAWQQEQKQQWSISGRRQQKSLVEEEAENWYQTPISGRRQQQSLEEGETENWQERPISGRRQQQCLAEEDAENWQQRPVSGHRQQQSLAEEEAENWRRQPVSGRRQQKSLVEEETEPRPVSGRQQQKSSVEEEDEIWQRRPISGRRQQKSLAEEEDEIWQKRPISGRRQQKSSAEEEDEIWQKQSISARRQEKSLVEEEAENWQQRPISGRQQEKSLMEEEAENWQQRPLSGRRQKQSLVEEEDDNWLQQRGREKQRLPSPPYKRQQEIQEEKKSLDLSMEQGELQQRPSMKHQEPVESVIEDQLSHLHSSKSELKMNKENSPLDGSKLELNKEQPQSQTKEEGAMGQKEKPDVKSQPPARRPPSLPAQPASPSLESSVSDPVILATIPPPVKKMVVPPAPTDTKLKSSVSTPPPVKKTVVPPAPTDTKLESSVSTPPPSSVPELKGSKLPPTVDDLLANFEAFRRARKGE